MTQAHSLRYKSVILAPSDHQSFTLRLLGIVQGMHRETPQMRDAVVAKTDTAVRRKDIATGCHLGDEKRSRPSHT